MVIQRWQSLLLLVAAVMMGCFAFCTLAQVQTTDILLEFSSLGFTSMGESARDTSSDILFNTWYFFILSVTSMIIFLIDIFLYRNLPLQKKICLIGVLMVVASYATCVSLGNNAIFDVQHIHWSAVSYIAPAMAAITAVFAWFRMRSDYNKLKAVDRIR